MTEIHIFSFPNNPKLLSTIQTNANPRGGYNLASSPGSLSSKTGGGESLGTRLGIHVIQPPCDCHVTDRQTYADDFAVLPGLCEVCPSVDCQLMAFPGKQKGTVQIMVSVYHHYCLLLAVCCTSHPSLLSSHPFLPSQDLLATEAPQMAATEVICHVHQHEVCCIAINQQGTRIATCSTKVRWYTEEGEG